MSLEGKSPEEITALAQLSDSVLSNPKFRTPYQRLLKAANPGISLPEVDMLDTVAAAVRPHIDKVAEMEQKAAALEAAAEAQNAANVLFECLKDDSVVRTRADFQALVKYANDNGFQTVEPGLRLAASHRDAETTLAKPSPMQGAGSDFAPSSTNETYKDFFKDAKGTATRIANEMVSDLKSGKLKLPPVPATQH